MVASLLNVRKRAITLADTPSVAVRAPFRAFSRLSRLGLVTRHDSFAGDLVTSDVSASPQSPTSPRSVAAGSLRPLKQVRRQSRSFSSVLTSMFPASPPPSSPPSPSVSVSFGRPRSRFGGEKKNRRDGLKHRISYPVLRESFDKGADRDSWGARDQSTRPPTPMNALDGSVSSYGGRRELPSCASAFDSLGSASSPTTAPSSLSSSSYSQSSRSLARSLFGQTDSGHSSLRSHPPRPEAPFGQLLSRFSTSTDESVYSQSTASSGLWLDYPTTTTTTLTPSPFAPVQEEDLFVPEYASNALGLDIQAAAGQQHDDILESPPPSPEVSVKQTLFASSPSRFNDGNLTWTSQESTLVHRGGAEPAKSGAEVAMSARRPKLASPVMTPPPTPRINAVVRSPPSGELELTPTQSKTKHDYMHQYLGFEADQDMTSVSLLSLTLAELAEEEPAGLRADSMESSDGHGVVSAATSLPHHVPFPTSAAPVPRSFLDLGSATSSEADFNGGSPSPLPRLHERGQPLLRRISQRLRPARLAPAALLASPKKPSFSALGSASPRPPTSPGAGSFHRIQRLDEEDPAAPCNSPTKATFPRRMARSSLHIFSEAAPFHRKGSV
ncbi:hypothetical protein JCM8202v2_005939 [Rhodotorula sphaerocarpa]